MQTECLNPNTAKDIRAGSLKCVAMVVDLLNANTVAADDVLFLL